MIELIPVSKIKVDRELTPSPDSTALSLLKQDLLNRGLQVPILLSPDLYVIDGQRRLEAIKEAGLPDAICQVTTDFDEALENLAKAQAGKFRIPLTPSRLYYQYGFIAEMGRARQQRRRANVEHTGSRAKGTLKLAEPLGSFREDYMGLIGQAISGLQYVISTFKHYEELEEGPAKEELRHLLILAEGPGGSIQRAYKYHRSLREGRMATSVPDQRRILENATAAMRGLEAGLTHIGRVHRQLPQEEVEEWVKQTRSFVGFMRSFNNELERQLRE